jgi:hypothetical protein
MELMRIPRSGGEVQPTGIVVSRLTHPRFHPDGRRLAYGAGKRRSMVWAVENLPGVRGGD